MSMNKPVLLDFNVTFGSNRLADCISEERKKKNALHQNLRIKHLNAYHNHKRDTHFRAD